MKLKQGEIRPFSDEERAKMRTMLDEVLSFDDIKWDMFVFDVGREGFEMCFESNDHETLKRIVEYHVAAIPVLVTMFSRVLGVEADDD